MKARACPVLASFVGLFSAPLVAQDSADVSARWRLMSSAFRCSVWADTIGRSEERDRLFDIGYEAGKEYVEAVRADPGIALVGSEQLMLAPTADFALGRQFEIISQIALAIVGAGEPPSTEIEISQVQGVAGYAYRRSNCDSISLASRGE